MTVRLNTFRFLPVHGSWRRPTTSTADLPDHLTPSQGVAPTSGSLTNLATVTRPKPFEPSPLHPSKRSGTGWTVPTPHS